MGNVEGVDGAGSRPRVWVRLSEEILSASRLAQQRAFSDWMYLGADAERYFGLQRALGGRGREIPSGPLLNEVADTFQDEILNFDRVLDVRSELRWQATDTAERNLYTSKFIHRCSSALVLARVLGELDESLLVVVDDVFLKHRLAGLARTFGWEGDGRFRRSADAVRRVRHRAYLVGLSFAHRAYFLWAFASSRRKIHSVRRAPPMPALDRVLVTWVDPGTFAAKQPIERETYFGALPGALRDRGLRVGYVGIPAGWSFPIEAILANVAAAGDPVLVVDEGLRWRDVLSIVATTLGKPVRVREGLEVGGIDLTGQLVDELRSESKYRQLWAMRFFYVGRDLARQGAPALVLHPFENQPWEKLLRLGIRQGLPGTEVVGYQHTPISGRWFQCFPSRRDLAAGQLPDRVLTVGPFWSRLFAAHGYPPERLAVAPALRYPRIEAPRPGGQGAARARPRTVLVMGAMDFGEALQVVVKGVRALEPLDRVRLAVKLHPKMAGGRDRFLAAVTRVLGDESPPPALEFLDGLAADALSKADIVLYAGTSASYDALSAGVPIVCVRSDFWFDLDPIPAGADVGLTVRTPEELRDAIEGLLTAGGVAADRQEHLREFLRDTLAAGDATAFASILERDTEDRAAGVGEVTNPGFAGR